MKEKNTLQIDINGKEMMHNCLSILEKSCEDFVDVKAKYNEAILKLKDIFVDVDKLIEYGENMIVSTIEFAYHAGYEYGNSKYNEKNDANNFDYDMLFNETGMHSGRNYIATESERKKIVELLPIKAIALYEHIVEYEAFLESYLPKMAHYYGVVAGISSKSTNLSRNQEDNILCDTYKKWLSRYLCFNFN